MSTQHWFIPWVRSLFSAWRVHRSELRGLTKKNWTENEWKSRKCPKKNSERASESWRTVDQDTLKIKESLAAWRETREIERWLSTVWFTVGRHVFIVEMFQMINLTEYLHTSSAKSHHPQSHSHLPKQSEVSLPQMHCGSGGSLETDGDAGCLQMVYGPSVCGSLCRIWGFLLWNKSKSFCSYSGCLVVERISIWVWSNRTKEASLSAFINEKVPWGSTQPCVKPFLY